MINLLKHQSWIVKCGTCVRLHHDHDDHDQSSARPINDDGFDLGDNFLDQIRTFMYVHTGKSKQV